MKCANTACGKEIETLKGVSYQITGWDQNRTQGGTNAVLQRSRTGKILCPSCTTSMKAGVPIHV